MPARGSNNSIFEPGPVPLPFEGERRPTSELRKDYRTLSRSMDPGYSGRSTSGKIDILTSDQTKILSENPELISEITQKVLQQLREENYPYANQ